MIQNARMQNPLIKHLLKKKITLSDAPTFIQYNEPDEHDNNDIKNNDLKPLHSSQVIFDQLLC